MGDIARVHCGAGRVISLSSDPLSALDPGSVEALLKKTPGLTHLAVVHHETSTGLLNPIERLFELAQRYGVALIVDAMSSFAALPIDLEITPYPYLIASSNKCLQGMAGASFVIARGDALAAIADHPPRSLYLDLHAQHRALAAAGQMRFTPPVQTLYALDRALDETLQEGVARRLARYRRNGQLLRDGLNGLASNWPTPTCPRPAC